MGITGAPFGRTELLVPPLEPQERDLARGKDLRGPGGWGVGKKLKNVAFLGHFFLNFFAFFHFFANFQKKMKKIDEIGQICSDWAHVEPERFPASSFRLPGAFWPIFPKNRETNKILIFRKIQIFRIFRGNLKQTAGPHLFHSNIPSRVSFAPRRLK